MGQVAQTSGEISSQQPGRSKKLPVFNVQQVVMSGLATGAVIGLVGEILLATLVPATTQIELIAALVRPLVGFW